MGGNVVEMISAIGELKARSEMMGEKNASLRDENEKLKEENDKLVRANVELEIRLRIINETRS